MTTEDILRTYSSKFVELEALYRKRWGGEGVRAPESHRLQELMDAQTGQLLDAYASALLCIQYAKNALGLLSCEAQRLDMPALQARLKDEALKIEVMSRHV